MRKFLVSVTILAALPTLAATYHVAPNGSNANSGSGISTAFATIQHGANIALAGDSVLVHPGNYEGFFAMDHSGTASDPIVFITDGAVQITSPNGFTNLDGINVENVSWIVIEGFIVNAMPRAGIRSAISDHVSIRYNTCTDSGKWGIFTGFAEHCIIEHNSCSGSIDEHGIYFSNSADDPIIRYNECFDNNANGIHMNGDESEGGDGTISNAQVYGNVVHGNGVAGGSGINCDGVVNSAIYNNLLYANHASGISLYQIDGGAPSTGNKVYNNTIINASDARWCVNITDDCTGNQVVNNILINQHPFRGSIVVAENALAGFISDYNLVQDRLSPDGDATILNLAAWQALAYDTHSQVVDPQSALFSSPGLDFHALNGSAQQVNAGTNAVANTVSVDLEEIVRPMGSAFDIGCYEYDATTMMHDDVEVKVGMRVINGQLQITVVEPGSTLTWYGIEGRKLKSETVLLAPGYFPIPDSPFSLAVLQGPGQHVQLLKVVK